MAQISVPKGIYRNTMESRAHKKFLNGAPIYESLSDHMHLVEAYIMVVSKKLKLPGTLRRMLIRTKLEAICASCGHKWEVSPPM